MAYLIENNGFANDTYGQRATRLYYLSNSIDTYEAELSLESNLLAWAQGAVAEFDAAQVAQSAETGEMDDAFQTSQEADDALAERYQILKDLLMARYGDLNDKLQIYGINSPTPRTHNELIDAAEFLVEGHNRMVADSDPNVLPDTMITNLQSLIDEAKDTYYQAGMERLEARQATEEIRALYNNDSSKLRIIYNWAVAFWGKYDPRLIALGFVPATPRTGGGDTPAAPELGYSPNELYWDEVEGATSYQLVYKAAEDSEWIELYNGPQPATSIAFDPGEGNWEARIRARNENGYGDWSEIKTVFFGLRAPENVVLSYVALDTLYSINWSPVTGANNIEVWRSVVPIDDPAGTFTKVGEPVSPPYTEAATPDMRTYYYLVAVNAEYTSEPSDTQYYDLTS